ncbi:Hypothetical protein ACGLYG10_1785 [Actinomyces glycerinitolerans]|uniref:Uncharacterized protein n=1 Tax=Actinomyces glycerinitolerans TaxID=1892869 RepID=A0A1M4S011_9ACTO|nr:Hypothetical protein ACGLYG10_1785 [Actinomyces glycerinitolerans]
MYVAMGHKPSSARVLMNGNNMRTSPKDVRTTRCEPSQQNRCTPSASIPSLDCTTNVTPVSTGRTTMRHTN